MSQSAIPAAEAALHDQLEGHTAGAPLIEGKPEPLPAELVTIWEAESEDEYASLGGRGMYELIDLQVAIEVLTASGSDLIAPRERAREIAAEVEAAFRTDLTLGRAWLYGRISKRKQQPFRTDKQRGWRVFLTFSGKAQT